MRKVLGAALLVFFISGIAMVQELPTAEEIVGDLVEILLNSPDDDYAAAYVLYTTELALTFGIETETLLAAFPRGTDADTAISTLSSLPARDSQWTVRSNVDPITDETRWVLRNTATQGRSAYGDPPVLVLRWQAGRTEMYISWDDYISDNDRTVTWRIGEGDPVSQRLSISTDNQATFFPNRQAIEIIQQMMLADRFVARITPYNESSVTAVFDIRGLRAEVEARRDLASWVEPLDQEPDGPTASDRSDWTKPLRVPGN